ncbi:hypothetical protein [Phycicoccus sp.]|jgi:hypothetical protein|uniref:hypothetical protein n=2 Tax=Intrasporangiaceae TaxID=85021 RepID=UPI00258A729A|nr:hypothetical protein [Phycicoccus sp.]
MGDVMTGDERLADQPIDDIDLEILAQMRRGLEEVDPMPEGMTDRIQFALTVALLEAEVANMVSDAALAGVRSDDYDRATTITFASDGFSATISVETGRGGQLSMHGWTSEPGAEVEVRERARTQRTVADEHGRFAFASLQSGLVNLVFRRTGGPPPVITPALEI